MTRMLALRSSISLTQAAAVLAILEAGGSRMTKRLAALNSSPAVPAVVANLGMAMFIDSSGYNFEIVLCSAVNRTSFIVIPTRRVELRSCNTLRARAEETRFVPVIPEVFKELGVSGMRMPME